jgi:hypothetical protein
VCGEERPVCAAIEEPYRTHCECSLSRSCQGGVHSSRRLSLVLIFGRRLFSAPSSAPSFTPSSPRSSPFTNTLPGRRMVYSECIVSV